MTTPAPKRNFDVDAWVIAQRPSREVLDPSGPYAFFSEEESGPDGRLQTVSTILLTNRECPWRCVMCDLWRNTLTETIAPGMIPGQIDFALAQLAPARTIKLYNSGSFFDRAAIPITDHPAIAHRLRDFSRVIVECHPSLVGKDCLTFRDMLNGRLEVAMGLETAHPEVLARLNKGITLERFQQASTFLREHTMDLRVFILLQPPYMRPEDALFWAQRSLDFAFDCGATAATLILTRSGNGAMDVLAQRGEFVSPHLALLESAVHYGLSLNRGRVFADLWAVSQEGECPDCFPRRVASLRASNLHQAALTATACATCEAWS